MQGFCIVPDMCDYGSIHLDNSRICLNVPPYALKWPNIAYCAYARVLNSLRYSYNNFVIEYNVIVLEFFSA